MVTLHYTDPLATLYQGDCRDVLRSLPDESVQCVVTSPPYWGLRDYGVDGQMGLEPSPDEYVAEIVAAFREVRRVLRSNGTLWINMGDSYCASPKGSLNGQDKSGLTSTRTQEHSPVGIPKQFNGLKPKDLVGTPWMVAFALRADNWYLRRDIIWSKPNPMPESVTDRPTSAHEYMFLMSKSARYYYNADAIRTPSLRDWHNETRTMPNNPDRNDGGSVTSRPRKTDKQRGHSRRHAGFNDRWDAMTRAEQQAMGANARSVWDIATRPYSEAHFATYPPDLVRPCILAGTREGDTVLDPFAGSGTTLQVAKELHRHGIGIELSPDYCDIATKRIVGAHVGMKLSTH